MPLASSPMPMRRPDARPPALMAIDAAGVVPADRNDAACGPGTDGNDADCVEQTDGDDADRNQRTQRESPNRYHVPERERGPLGLDSPHVDHAEYAEQREDHGGEHGKCRQNPGYSLEDLSNVLRVLLHGGTSCGYAAYSSTPGPSTTGVPSVSLAELTTWRRTL